MTQKERMKEGRLYDPNDGAIMREQTARAHYLKEYNVLGQGDEARMRELMEQMFAEVGENCYIQPPFYANWAGEHVHLGSNFRRFGLTFLRSRTYCIKLFQICTLFF